MPARIRHVHAAPAHGHGEAVRGQRPLVGRRVDAVRQAAHHNRPAPAEAAGQIVRETHSLGGGPPAADHGHHGRLPDGRERPIDVAAHEQRHRRIGQHPEGPRPEGG